MAKPLTSTQFITAVLEAEFGAKTVPQIGLFKSGKPQIADLPAAQQTFSEQLVQQVQQQFDTTTGTASATSARVLVAGDALGMVAANLVVAGFEVVWVAGQDAQSPSTSETSSLQVISGDVLQPDLNGQFDGIVYGATFHYLDQLPLLTRFRELLKPAGHLWLAGEFLQDDSSIQPSSLANLSSHTQLGERLGFQAGQVSDFSDSALKSVMLFRQLLRHHRDKVHTTLNLDATTGAHWQDAFAAMEQELDTGRRCYQLHHWQLPELSQSSADADHQQGVMGEYALAEYGDIRSFNAPEIANLFEQSFDKKFDPDLWHWKYQQGKGKCVVARIDRGGHIVAHYGGAPRQICYFGKPSMAIQVCDVMVLPENRRQYGKSSLFFKVAATFLEREIGNSVNHLLGFGFPNQSAMNIAIRLGLYEKTDDFVEVVFPAPAGVSASVDVIDFDIDDTNHQDAVTSLWAQMQDGFTDAIIGQRHVDYIRYRYFDHPGTAQYACKLLRSSATGELLAFFVLKRHGEAQLVLDLICPLEQVEVLITSANQWVADHSLGTDLRIWLTRGWLSALPVDGATVNELGIEIPCNSWNPGPDAATLYGKWWLTAGDMDFM